MAVDYRVLAEDLRRFYDFAGKDVVLVGAGAKLFDPERSPKRIVAIDKKDAPLVELRDRMAVRESAVPLETVVADFNLVTLRADVVYFEFALHEMPEPMKTLEHAKQLAKDIVVFDHSTDSEWMFHAAEDEDVRRTRDAMDHFGVRRRTGRLTEQRFFDYAELFAKLSGQGPRAVERIQRFVGATNIALRMPYELTLL
jgi:hypothetical protein